MLPQEALPTAQKLFNRNARHRRRAPLLQSEPLSRFDQLPEQSRRRGKLINKFRAPANELVPEDKRSKSPSLLVNDLQNPA